MALSTTEQTEQSTMDYFKISGLTPDYVNIANVDFNSNGQVATTLNIYGDKTARDNNEPIKTEITNILIPQEIQDEIKTDLFGKLYPYLTAIIEIKHLIILRESLIIDKQDDEKQSIIDEYEEKIKLVYTDNGLISPF